jgi:integrase
MPTFSRLWTEEGRKWVEGKRARGYYEGRNGDEAIRYFRRVGEHLERMGTLVTPDKVDEETLHVLAKVSGKRGPSKRYYLQMLGGFLMDRYSNNVVRRTKFTKRFSKETRELRRLTAEERDDMFRQTPQGIDRVVLALFTQGLRAIEVLRLRVEDLHLETGWADVRGKGSAGEISGSFRITETIRRELSWYLPMRAQWARGRGDSGNLICRVSGHSLVGYHKVSIDRMVISAGERIGKRVTPHDLRRTAASVLEARGAPLRDIQAVLRHRNLSTTEIYLERLNKTDRMRAAADLLEVEETPTHAVA